MTDADRLMMVLKNAVQQIEIIRRAFDRQGFDAVPIARELLAALADTLHEEIDNA